ncbi:MAG: DUF3105 domain-containing protein [Ardenticatenales bacterium]|nr:DUF3105 domain-containing protein [Ardenticatenales bacterium]
MSTPSETKRSRGLKRSKQTEEKPVKSGIDSRYLLYGGGGLLLLALVVFLVLQLGSPLPGEALPDLGNLHVEPGAPHAPYNSNPPTSGPHFGNLANWGEHSESIADELQIHNLEDGGVIVHYNCPESCPDLVEQLREAIGQAFGGSFEEAQRRSALDVRDPQASHWILVPRPDMDTQIALTAWTRIDKLDAFDQERIVTFLRQFEGIDHHTGVE